MIFHTISGSSYEIDLIENKIRRLQGINNPSPRQGTDGEWKSFISISDLAIDSPLLIQWEGIKATLTSVVVKIEGSDQVSKLTS